MDCPNPSRLLLAGLVAAAPLAALAQAPPADTKEVPLSKVERKNRVPVSKDVLRVKLPRPVEASLRNGLGVLVMEDHRFPAVNVQLLIQEAGPIHEPAGQPGLASVTAQMLREGTPSRTSRQLAEELARLGATLFASASFGSDAATVNASGMSDNLEEWFAVLADVLVNPSFPGDELAKLKQRLKVQLQQQRSTPFFLLNERFSRAVFGTHPAAVVAATPESLDALAPEALARWHRERYVPQDAILAIAGDVRAAELMPRLEKWLEGWRRTELSPVFPPNPQPVSGRKVLIVDRPGSVQTTLALGNIAIERRDPDYVAVVVMNRVVGGGPAARLFLNLREEKGYTYGVYSNFLALKYPGPWRAGGDMRTEVTEGAMTEFLKEIGRIRDEKVPDTELEEAKRSLVASFALSLEQPTQLLGYAITRKVYGFPEDYWDTYPIRIMAVTADDVQRVARRYVDPESLQIVAVGDGGKIRAVMEKYGPVEVYDTEGRLVAADH
ncbi:MAG: hypothetical protein DMF50_10330 [Acidobacteria bacterium]|nr:MAG: hypothetical protein DMF50_10330 [Acidobacteriota bacterium]